MISNNYSTALSSGTTQANYKILDEKAEKTDEQLKNSRTEKKDDVRLRLQKQNELSVLSSTEAAETLALLSKTVLSNSDNALSAQGNVSSDAVAALLAN
jgi:hypothetical protein